MDYGTALSYDSNMSAHHQMHLFSKILGQQNPILHHRQHKRGTNTLRSQVMHKTKLWLRTVDSLLLHSYLFELKKPHSLCYAVLELHCLFLKQSWTPEMKRKTKKSLSEASSLPAQHFAAHKTFRGFSIQSTAASFPKYPFCYTSMFSRFITKSS